MRLQYTLPVDRLLHARPFDPVDPKITKLTRKEITNMYTFCRVLSCPKDTSVFLQFLTTHVYTF